jgi:hypothetical protein
VRGYVYGDTVDSSVIAAAESFAVGMSNYILFSLYYKYTLDDFNALATIIHSNKGVT